MRKLRAKELNNLSPPDMVNRAKRDFEARADGLHRLFSFLQNLENEPQVQLPLMGEHMAEASTWTVSSELQPFLVLQYFSSGLVCVMKNFSGSQGLGCLERRPQN